jgi:hypothetical protein
MCGEWHPGVIRPFRVSTVRGGATRRPSSGGDIRDDLAAKVNYSASLIGMVESMRRVPQADLAQRCDEAFTTPGTFARMQQRLRNLPFPASFRPFAAYEEIATSLRTFEHPLVPGSCRLPPTRGLSSRPGRTPPTTNWTTSLPTG